MGENIRRGIFVAIEGPNGVGKTTLVNYIKEHLWKADCSVLTTREPTDSELGQWIRFNQGNIQGKALACLVAANRYEHIESVIRPALEDNTVVLTDRYLASSFVYQISDGVPSEFIWSVNSECLPSDLTFCLFAPLGEISMRMADRSDLTRFEQSISPEMEASLYRNACGILQRKGWAVEIYNNERGCAEIIAAEIAERIVQLRNNHED